MGKNRERVRSCFSPRLKPPRQTRGRPQFIANERITPRAATAFKIYYAVKSHLAAARRIVEGCWNTCAALLRAVDAALEGEMAREREDACEREAAFEGEAARIGEEGGGTASDGGGGTCTVVPK